MSFVDKCCEARTANGSGAYAQCNQEAVRINRFGWYQCQEHSSVADEPFDSAVGRLRMHFRQVAGTGQPRNESKGKPVRVAGGDEALLRTF